MDIHLSSKPGTPAFAVEWVASLIRGIAIDLDRCALAVAQWRESREIVRAETGAYPVKPDPRTGLFKQVIAEARALNDRLQREREKVLTALDGLGSRIPSTIHKDGRAWESSLRLKTIRLCRAAGVAVLGLPSRPDYSESTFPERCLKDSKSLHAGATALFRFVESLQALPAERLPPRSSEFRPASWFRKGMAARLRKAAAKDRVSKRVATRKVDKVVLYSVEDVRSWWPDAVLN